MRTPGGFQGCGSHQHLSPHHGRFVDSDDSVHRLTFHHSQDTQWDLRMILNKNIGNGVFYRSLDIREFRHNFMSKV